MTRIRKTMKRSGHTVSNDASLATLRLYTLIAFAWILVLMVGILAANMLYFDTLIDGINQAGAAGQRMDYTVYAALLNSELELIGLTPSLADVGIPGMTDASLHNNIYDMSVKLHDVNKALLLGTDTIVPLSDDVNIRINQVPNILVDNYSPGLLTLTWAVCIVILS